MKKVFIGIDVSKSWLDYVIRQEGDLKILEEKRINNDFKDISKMCSQLIRKYSVKRMWFCFEHTGNYGLLLSFILEEKSLTYSAVPALEIKQSSGITRGKNDKVDAARIAEYAAVKKHKLKPTSLPSRSLLEIKYLIAYRRQLVKVRTQFKNSLKAYKVASQSVNLEGILRDIKMKILNLNEDIEKIENQILERIKKQPELNNNYKLVTSVKGIGLVVAAYMILRTNNFVSFEDPRKFNCYTGLAPFENSSGLRQGKSRTSNLANKIIKAALHSGANSAVQYDPQIKKYYQRKLAEGKDPKSIKNAIACKLIYRAFATVRRQSPYVVLAN